MSGFKISILVCLVIFHFSNYCATEEVKIDQGQMKDITSQIKNTAEKQEQTLSLLRGNKNKGETEMEKLTGLIANSTDKQEQTLSLLRSNMKETEAKMTKNNELLDGISKILATISTKGDAKTFTDLTEVTSQVEDKVVELIGGAVYLITEEVRYPQEALGLFSLNSTYNKKVAPKHKTVRGWMRPTFVTDIDSMKQRMGLEIFFVLMWQEDSRVNWALKDEMEEGVAFSFSPSVLE